jgi:hypothetical protein
MFPSFLRAPDEEMGKKDDDHRAGPTPKRHGLRGLLRVRRKRVLLFILAVGLIWFLFTHNLHDMLPKVSDEYIQANPHGGEMEVVDNMVPYAGQLGNHFREVYDVLGDSKSTAPAPQPFIGKKPDRSTDATEFYYEGELKFYALPSTMHAARRLGGYRQTNRNVLFAAASLQAVSLLISRACAMAQQTTNNVHLVLMGRNDLPIEEILRVNGIERQTCRVLFHDGRPDYAPYSSDLRAESAVGNGLKYIHEYLHPQVVIIGADVSEDDFFTRTIKIKAKDYSIPLIQFPGPAESVDRRAIDNLAWISRLDSVSLAAWHQPNIEIIIQAHTGSSGPLIRLLQSLAKADYVGTIPPRLNIELPSETDKVFQRFLNEFQWPPGSTGEENTGINLRRRIPIPSQSPTEAAIRFMESFYPAHHHHSHVLVLSPDVQVTPLYFQALRYYILQYKYSLQANTFPPLMGISLSLPNLHLNGSTAFELPTMAAFETTGSDDIRPVNSNIRPPFIWEAPATDAALYFGSTWLELHSFLSLRLAKFRSEKDPKPREKLVGSHMPSWAEFVLEFMRARGYSMFYPGSALPLESHASLSTDSPSTPDEFYNTPPKDGVVAHQKRSPNKQDIFIEPFHPPPSLQNHVPIPASLHTNYASPMTFTPLLPTLPFTNGEPNLLHVPHYSYEGTQMHYSEVPKHVALETETFTEEIGGCKDVPVPEGRRRARRDGSAEDLFCWGDGMESWEDIPGYDKRRRDMLYSETMEGDSRGLRSGVFKAPGEV